MARNVFRESTGSLVCSHGRGSVYSSPARLIDALGSKRQDAYNSATKSSRAMHEFYAW